MEPIETPATQSGASAGLRQRLVDARPDKRLAHRRPEDEHRVFMLVPVRNQFLTFRFDIVYGRESVADEWATRRPHIRCIDHSTRRGARSPARQCALAAILSAEEAGRTTR